MSRKLNGILDAMEETRQERIMERPQIWQMNGFRTEWNAYVSEWIEDNADWN